MKNKDINIILDNAIALLQEALVVVAELEHYVDLFAQDMRKARAKAELCSEGWNGW